MKQKEKYNALEVQYKKDSGDITIPSRVVVVATNSIEAITNAVELIKEKELARLSLGVPVATGSTK